MNRIRTIVKQYQRALLRRIPLSPAIRQLLIRLFCYPRLDYCRSVPDKRGSNVLIVSFFQSGVGIGEAARKQIDSLRQAGKKPALYDVSEIFSINDLSNPNYENSEHLPSDGPILLHVNSPEAGLALKHLGRKIVAGRPIIGFWYWELDKQPRDWWRAYQYLTELWTPSEYVADVFRENSPIPVRTVPIPVSAPQNAGHDRANFGLDEDICLYLCMADCRSDLNRKNIGGCIEAFKIALGNCEKAQLLVKVHHAAHAPETFAKITHQADEVDNIRIMPDLLTREEIGDLIRCCDVFVSLHRSEGFSLPLAEAMMLGKPVIATAYSGNMTFMNDQVAKLVNYELQPVNTQSHAYQHTPSARWAEPDLHHAAEAMRELFDSEELRQDLGTAGKEFSTLKLSPKKLLSELDRWVNWESS